MPKISQETFKHIRRIQINTTRLVDDLFAGAYHSIFKGHGMEFEEVREYTYGDEIRNVDWNVSARMNNLFVKNFREERELTVTLVVDVSASTRFGSDFRRKKDLIAEIGAVLAFSAIKNNDKVGLLLFSDVVEKYIPPKKGLTHVLRVIRELLAFSPLHKGTNIEAALTYLGQVQRRQCICFLISDFICPDFSKSITVTARHYDLISIAITDPYETEFPDVGLASLADLETGKKRMIDTSNPATIKIFKEKAKEKISFYEKLMDKIGADFIRIESDQNYVLALRKFFALRKRKR